ncbi:type I secretion system permease/ATPase [Frigidibacter sp.]|uniref:type I secretion system permease/ATPase n=1 Tax=Frigidibacter sp. TaxID=2586418 RepID=UPI002733149B|nr:ATP-binding cassette domain-containing protein [Frigidibacter sp.]MDP3341634.1 ATP-binding cassette domain-containing protein [Frigidibacter sp.]
MAEEAAPKGPGAALAESRGALTVAMLFSAAGNLLLLTGPIFVMQVYDRVLGAQSAETLAALGLIAAACFTGMVALEAARGRIMARIGARLRARLEPGVLGAAPGAAADLEALQRALSLPAAGALMDLPWVPIFLIPLFAFHPLLGGLAMAGGALLVAIAVSNRAAIRTPLATAQADAAAEAQMAARLAAEPETLAALGLRPAALARWQGARDTALRSALHLSDRAGFHAALARGARQAMQSVLLAAAAWQVLRGEIGAGALFASSVLTARALAPIEQIVAGWPALQQAAEGWARLCAAPHPAALAAPPMVLPRPPATLDVRQLAVVPPGEPGPVLRGVSFRLEPGQALGVIGPAGAGKTTLLRALTGAWPAAAGSVQFGGATLQQYGPDLARLVGYLSQRVPLFEGDLAANIARLDPAPDPDKVIAAARRAGAHEMILAMPHGYDTQVKDGGAPLSGGQIQRIALARAMFGNPLLLLLDEPDAGLDADGEQALTAALRAHRAAGGIAVLSTHRTAAIRECDLLLVLEHGIPRAFGPREAVLRQALAKPTSKRAAGSAA